MEIQKGMYELSQERNIVNDKLELAPRLYHPTHRPNKKYIQYLWRLVRRAILWNKFIVELLQTESPALNAKLCDQSTAKFSTPTPRRA